MFCRRPSAPHSSHLPLEDSGYPLRFWNCCPSAERRAENSLFCSHCATSMNYTDTLALSYIPLKQDRSVSSECKLVITYRLFFCWSDLLIVRVGFRDGIRSVFVQLWAFGIALDEKQREGYIKRHNREHFTTKKYANTATIFLLPSNY